MAGGSKGAGDAELELEAIDHVALVARLHAERLPETSEWRSYFAELASALAEDAAGVSLVSHPSSVSS